eukprot:137066-Hanusia_phi.AAC.1
MEMMMAKAIDLNCNAGPPLALLLLLLFSRILVQVALAALQGVDRVVEAYGNVLESSAGGEPSRYCDAFLN